MLLDAGHRRWIIGAFLLLLVATAAYIPYARSAPHGPSGGSWPGLIYGGVGLALMIYAGLLGARRKIPTWRVGRATAWMKGHLWLGLASYVVILYHSGFQWGGPVTLVLMVLFTIVVLSGIYGLTLQQVLPKKMLADLPLETVYEEIDSIVAQLRGQADALVAAVTGALPVAEPMPASERHGGGDLGRAEVLARRAPSVQRALSQAAESLGLREAYLAEIRPFLGRTLPRNGRHSRAREGDAVFRHLRTILSPPFHDVVDELHAICEERRQLAVQKRLHHWLHGWLLVHVPLSMALLLLAIVHAVVSVRY